MRRGFKTEANAVAREVRAELSLSRTSPLDVWRLAEHLEIPVLPLSSFQRVASDAAKLFLNGGQGMFSGVAVKGGVIMDRRGGCERSGVALQNWTTRRLL